MGRVETVGERMEEEKRVSLRRGKHTCQVTRSLRVRHVFLASNIGDPRNGQGIGERLKRAHCQAHAHSDPHFKLDPS